MASVRPMTWNDIPQVLEIWRDSGLSEGTHTIQTWFRFDPDGFFIVADDSGEILGSCAAVVLHDKLAFVGLYAVRKSHQGKGLGLKVWKTAMDHVAERNAGLNSVPEHLHTYRDLAGFKIVAPWSTLLCQGTPDTTVLKKEPEGIQVIQLRASVLPSVINYDSKIHGYDRSKIVTLSASEEDCVSLAAIRTGTGRICGYGCLKKSVQNSLLVGPLYADRADIAEALLRQLIEEYPESCGQLTIAMVDSNEEALCLADRLKLEDRVKIPRCYTREQVPAHVEKVFSQHALNFSPF
ncbi:uncharacterized protein F36G3.2-like [Uloborus diversus]|uniref:uncharacterized protein F36G3.2-like n=1 Tax=Uloborus diversus TaxID=327109 RepID=UPI00240A270A|nr:uncharacterized protein F36G3.2-like [Uloborus diversus]